MKLLFCNAEQNNYRGFDADQFESKNDDHGRVEHRLYSILDADDLPVAMEWEGMKSVGRVIRRRTYGDRSTFETCYYILSLEIDAKFFAHAVRSHWVVENKMIRMMKLIHYIEASILILFPLAKNIEVDYYHAYLAACDPIYPVF